MTERGERATGVRDGWAGRARPAGQAQAAADASLPPRNTPTHHARRTATAATGGRGVAGGGRQHQRGGQAAAQPRPGGRGACAAGGRARPPVGDHAGPAANGVAPCGRAAWSSGGPPAARRGRTRGRAHGTAAHRGHAGCCARPTGGADLPRRDLAAPPLTGWPRVPAVSAALRAAMDGGAVPLATRTLPPVGGGRGAGGGAESGGASASEVGGARKLARRRVM